MKVSELTGGLLDYWVAKADESWKWAHEIFPAMTLDPTFKEADAFERTNGELECMLIPNNPFRQDHQVFRPSTVWDHGGPVMERAAIGWRNATPRPQVGAHKGLSSVDDQPWEAWFCDDGPEGGNVVHRHAQTGHTMLEACMRAVVASKYGEEVVGGVTHGR